MLNAALRKLAESELVLVVAVILVGFGYSYLRNGPEYFTGNSGGAYWDNMNYCKTHRQGQMKIYKQLVSCQEILAHRRYCRKQIDESISIDGTTIPCDSFLGVEEDDHSPWDI